MGEAVAPETMRPAAWLSGLCGAYVAALVFLALLVGPDSSRQPAVVLFDDGARFVLAALAAGASFWRARRAPPALAASWLYLGQAMAALAAALLWLGAGVDALHVGPPWSQLRHVGYVAQLVLIARALLAWPSPPGLPSQRLRSLLDGLMITGALFFVAWGAFLRELVHRRAESDTAYALTLFYPAGAVALASLWLFQDARLPRGRFGAPRILLRLGLLALLLHHVLLAGLSIGGGMRRLGLLVPLDLFSTAAVVLFGLSALWPRRPEPPPQQGARAHAARLLPFLPGALALLFGAGQLLLGHRFDLLQAGAGLLVVLVLFARQFVTLRDLDRLSAELERRVEQRTAEITRQKAELLRVQRTQVVAGLAAGLAHDVKNLLFVSLTWIRLLRDRPTEEELGEGLRAIERSALEGAELVQQVLTAGRQQECHPADFDLEGFVAARQGLLRGVVHDRARLEAEIAPGLTVHMDPEHLHLALLNLVANAKDAMERPGTIALRAARDPLEPFALLRVSDDGSGMGPEVVAHLFEPFFTTKPPGKGTGLGLASVQSVLWQNRGSIEVESAPGRGTTFTLRLPLSRPVRA